MMCELETAFCSVHARQDEWEPYLDVDLSTYGGGTAVEEYWCTNPSANAARKSGRCLECGLEGGDGFGSIFADGSDRGAWMEPFFVLFERSGMFGAAELSQAGLSESELIFWTGRVTQLVGLSGAEGSIHVDGSVYTMTECVAQARSERVPSTSPNEPQAAGPAPMNGPAEGAMSLAVGSTVNAQSKGAAAWGPRWRGRSRKTGA